MDQRQAAGSYIAESWLRKRGSDFRGRPCLGREVGNSIIFLEAEKFMSYTPFNPSSKRAIAGLGFQKNMLEELQCTFPNIEFEMTWDFFKRQKPELTNKELAIIEKKEGDITYLYNGSRHFIECCYAMGDKISRLCEMKRRQFVGENKWYCYGFANSNDVIFIPSKVWKKYTSKIKPADKTCRIVPLSSIRGVKAGCLGIENYWKNVHFISKKT